ncbi:hypothetical protein LP089_00500 [Moraxella bovis]|uniref:hypothetical protein n=3 Tax=Moraxella bovis TaxID=476 RepID=UPI002227F8BF|nr:hypothetical protein [Moraxella bovis]UYZ71008.1 hypothetical protein LP089_00500 [Moraxella bovis]UZA38135.1 hypothetical protein LP101_00490 [Moraxella bovis]
MAMMSNMPLLWQTDARCKEFIDQQDQGHHARLPASMQIHNAKLAQTKQDKAFGSGFRHR